MSGTNINFANKNIKKSEYYKNRKVFQEDDVDVNKLLVSLLKRIICHKECTYILYWI